MVIVVERRRTAQFVAESRFKQITCPADRQLNDTQGAFCDAQASGHVSQGKMLAGFSRHLVCHYVHVVVCGTTNVLFRWASVSESG
jgi:hypothetical protein